MKTSKGQRLVLVTWSKVQRLAGTNMANEKTAAAPDSVQCPVCFKDFTSATINGHLDICLLKGVTDSSPSTADESGPPVKKSRTGPEAIIKPAASSSSVASAQSPGMFSLFQSNRGKPPVQTERNGLFVGKQSPGSAANKGVKRLLNEEADLGAAGTETLRSQQPAPASSGQGLKTAKRLSPRTLLAVDKPLAEVLRPETLEEYFGQNKVVGEQSLFRPLLDSQEIPSLILWGPPGCGKVWRWPSMMLHLSPALLSIFLLFDMWWLKHLIATDSAPLTLFVGDKLKEKPVSFTPKMITGRYYWVNSKGHYKSMQSISAWSRFMPYCKGGDEFQN